MVLPPLPPTFTDDAMLKTTPPEDENEMLPVRHNDRVYFVPRHFLATHHTEKRWMKIVADCESVSLEEYNDNKR